jgi:iron complex transport system ATP-binding protein
MTPQGEGKASTLTSSSSIAGRRACSIRFVQASVELGDKLILEGIDFGVSPGEVVGLVGPNGVGKTTLLRLAAGMLSAKSGDIVLGDRSLASLTRREIAQRVALVPQDLHVSFPFRVGELVMMGRAPHQPLVGLESESDVARALEALERLGIAHLADRGIETLSGGERQLVLFARALVQDPDLLLLDEPTAFLDLKHRVDVLQEIRAFARLGRAALVVSHDLSLAARSCDRIVLLAPGAGTGRVAAVGLPAEILTAENLRGAFGIETLTFPGPDGALVVVPRLSEVDGS